LRDSIGELQDRKKREGEKENGRGKPALEGKAGMRQKARKGKKGDETLGEGLKKDNELRENSPRHTRTPIVQGETVQLQPQLVFSFQESKKSLSS